MLSNMQFSNYIKLLWKNSKWFSSKSKEHSNTIPFRTQFSWIHSPVRIAHIHCAFCFRWSSIKCAAFVVDMHFHCDCCHFDKSIYLCTLFDIFYPDSLFSLLFLPQLDKKPKNLHTNESMTPDIWIKFHFEMFAIFTIFIDRYGKFLIKIVCTATKKME